MFGFGWVRTHLGVVFGDAFGLLWGFWLDFWKKGQNQQLWANFEVLRLGVGIPYSSVGPRQGVACPHCGVVEMRHGQASGTLRRKGLHHSIAVLRRNIATVHSMKFFVFVLFCFSVAPRTCLLD